METCAICNGKFKSINGLGIHIRLGHKISTKEYYDKYLYKVNEEICPICGGKNKFIGLRIGYSKYCCRSCANTVAGKICIEKHPEIVQNLVLNIGYAHKMHTEKKRERFHKERPKSFDIDVLVNSIKKVRRHGFELISDVWDMEESIIENAWKEHIRRVRAKAGRIYHKKHPKNENSIISCLFRDGKRDELTEICRKGTIGFIKKYGNKKYIEMSRAVKRESRKKAGHNSFLLRNKKYSFEGESFLSKEEIKCFSFLRGLGLTKEEINHEYQVDSYFIDFFPLRKFFWEYHPLGVFGSNETLDQYYSRRRKVLDDNGYKDYKLIVTTSLKELPIIEEEIRSIKQNGNNSKRI